MWFMPSPRFWRSHRGTRTPQLAVDSNIRSTSVENVAEDTQTSPLRWRLAEDESVSDALFPDETVAQRHVGTGEYRGMEFLHVNAKRVINEVPNSSRMPFRFTINPYRGCSHACSYCLGGDTLVLMGDSSTKPISELVAGDEIYGTRRVGSHRRFVRTHVLDSWATVKAAYRVCLQDGTELIASGDHRFLTNLGWKHVIGDARGPGCRPVSYTHLRAHETGRNL